MLVSNYNTKDNTIHLNDKKQKICWLYLRKYVPIQDCIISSGLQMHLNFPAKRHDLKYFCILSIHHKRTEYFTTSISTT